MGYTHYWTFKDTCNQDTYELALRQCARIARHYNKTIKAIDPKSDERLSGFTAHTKVSAYGGLDLNGVGEHGHEPFTLRADVTENVGFGFCKTARKPYDIVIVACLATLKHYLGNAIDVSSDGRPIDWTNGVRLANSVLRTKIVNPIEEEIAA